MEINWHYIEKEGLPKPDCLLKNYLVAYHPKCADGTFAEWEETSINIVTLDCREPNHPWWHLPLGWNPDNSLFAWAELDQINVPELPKLLTNEKENYMTNATEAKELTKEAVSNTLKDWCESVLDKLIKKATQACHTEVIVPTYEFPDGIKWQDVAYYIASFGYKSFFKSGYDNGQFDSEPDCLIISW